MPSGITETTVRFEFTDAHVLNIGLAALASLMVVYPWFVYAQADDEGEPAIATKASPRISYTREIAVLFDNNCTGCHADDLHAKPDQESDFDITSPSGLLAGGEKTGPAVIPGNPEDSPLIHYLRGLKEPTMPKNEPPLSEADIRMVEQWIASGAVFDDGMVVAETAGNQVAPSEMAPFPPFETGKNRIQQYVQNRYERLALVRTPAEPPQCNVATNNPIDNFIVAKFRGASLPTEYPLCSDNAFVRRVYLDIVGSIPSRDETASFLEGDEPLKRAKLIDLLLAADADYAAAWVPFWEEALCSRNEVVVNKDGISMHGHYREWIFQSFKENKPYDIFASELIDPFLPGHPEKYVLRDTQMEVLQSAANTAQVFLGTRMKCASCHNHFDNDKWSQNRFFGFAGFLAREDLELIRCETPTGRYVPTQYAFDLPNKRLDAPMGVENRAARFAELLVDPTNPRFAKTIINRLWKRYLGTGFFEPADDFRENRPASHPELLDWLAYELMSHDFDLKHIIRLILNSRTYQHAYDPALTDLVNLNDLSNSFYFRSPSCRRLSAEQFADSLSVALENKGRGEFRAFRTASVTPFMHALGRPLSRDSVSTSRSNPLGVILGLELLNSEEYNMKLYNSPLTSKLAEQIQSTYGDMGAIHDMYWRTLGRPPKEEEIKEVKSYISSRPSSISSNQTAGDLLWVLCTSPEFQYIH